MTKPRFIRPWVGKTGGQLCGEPHAWSLLAARKEEIRVRSVDWAVGRSPFVLGHDFCVPFRGQRIWGQKSLRANAILEGHGFSRATDAGAADP
jgi:hypothetical protein